MGGEATVAVGVLVPVEPGVVAGAPHLERVGEGAEVAGRVVHERHPVAEVPADRWDINAYYDPNPDAPGKIDRDRTRNRIARIEREIDGAGIDGRHVAQRGALALGAVAGLASRRARRERPTRQPPDGHDTEQSRHVPGRDALPGDRPAPGRARNHISKGAPASWCR